MAFRIALVHAAAPMLVRVGHEVDDLSDAYFKTARTLTGRAAANTVAPSNDAEIQ